MVVFELNVKSEKIQSQLLPYESEVLKEDKDK